MSRKRKYSNRKNDKYDEINKVIADRTRWNTVWKSKSCQ